MTQETGKPQPQAPHLWNLIHPITARKAARALRRRGYQVTVNQQWLTVGYNWQDFEPGVVLARYQGIAY